MLSAVLILSTITPQHGNYQNVSRLRNKNDYICTNKSEYKTLCLTKRLFFQWPV